jgi:hypothetical protein
MKTMQTETTPYASAARAASSALNELNEAIRNAASMPRRQRFFGDVSLEVERAYRKHGRKQWSRHEFYAILLEEVEETIEAFRFRFFLPRRLRRLWKNIKHDEAQYELRKKIIQVASMCLRYLETGDRYRQPEKEDS